MMWQNEEGILRENPRTYHDGDARQERTWSRLGTQWHCHAMSAEHGMNKVMIALVGPQEY
jgi:hypothetical protein